MKVRKLLVLATIPLLLVGCTGEKKSRGLIEGRIQTLARDQGDTVVGIPLVDRGHYNDQGEIVYTLSFKVNAPISAFSLTGGLAGKSIEKITMTEGENHVIYVYLAGKCNDMSATEGDIVIKPEAVTIEDHEYDGFTFYVPIALGDETIPYSSL